ncbi:Lysophospholipase 3 [Grifola frondosa]|uniref:Lysophospholipase n=1 Tax=Grifola frondosa TaxID=5627 RepID=A0A1C7MT93_GRIFR|nr:Lysophospholipase 3 [Grifola frondosa]
MGFDRSLVYFSILLCWSFVPVMSQSAAAIAYTPVLAPCPPGVELVRLAGNQSQSLSADESTYISTRRRDVLPAAFSAYLDNVVHATDAQLPSYVHDILTGYQGADAFPNLGIAVSGGGYRAAVFGAGVLHALDGRNSSSAAAGTGGLLQGASYLSGLSGGSWLVGSLAQANFPTIPDLVFGASDVGPNGFGGWLAEIDIVEVSTNASVTLAYEQAAVDEGMGKYALGFPVTLSDSLARLYSRHFVNGTNVTNILDLDLTHGAGVTFSSVADTSSFRAHMQPFPILVADSLSVDVNTSAMLNFTDVVVPLSNPVYEFNVFEMGSFDPMLSAFTPMKYLGSPNNSICVTNFDQMSFIESASSSQGAVAGQTIETQGRSSDPDPPPNPNQAVPTALIPNPFFGVAHGTFIDAVEPLLNLGDGSLNGEMVPLQPLLVKARGIDVILVIDAANQTDISNNFADGTSLIATQQRVSMFQTYYSFPPVPTSPSTFLSQNLTKYPTFFGCNTDLSAPLLIYLANVDQMNAMLAQTFDIATQGIPAEPALPSANCQTALEKDPEWPACLACAVVDRARSKVGEERSGVCTKCLAKYCWS